MKNRIEDLKSQIKELEKQDEKDIRAFNDRREKREALRKRMDAELAKEMLDEYVSDIKEGHYYYCCHNDNEGYLDEMFFKVLKIKSSGCVKMEAEMIVTKYVKGILTNYYNDNMGISEIHFTNKETKYDAYITQINPKDITEISENVFKEHILTKEY